MERLLLKTHSPSANTLKTFHKYNIFRTKERKRKSHTIGLVDDLRHPDDVPFIIADGEAQHQPRPIPSPQIDVSIEPGICIGIPDVDGLFGLGHAASNTHSEGYADLLGPGFADGVFEFCKI